MTKKKKAFIIGVNGLLGQAVVSIFNRESNFDIIQTSIEDEPYVDFASPYIKLDVTNKEDVKKIIFLHSPDFIINCAAYTDVDKCETERELCWKLNVDAVKNLIIASRANNSKIIHISTDYVFDGKNGPYTEDASPSPISFYGRSKLASENALLTSGVDYLIIRTIVLFGIGTKVKPNFALWLIKELGAKHPIKIVADQIGNTTYVDDLAYGILKAAELNKSGIFNVAGKDIISRLDFAYTLCDVFGFDKSLISTITTPELNQPAPRPLKSGLITLKAETELGIKPMDHLESIRLLKYQLGI